MGVPHFYTWLVNRFPLAKSTNNDATQPVIDWLFMDLNGVIYKCAMDDSFAFRDMIKGKKFEEIFAQILNYMTEIIQLVQPQKMLFLAFDGVAPKAKMNQQRARRFKSAKKYMELDEALRSFGIIDKEEHFKNNSISPGTEFMFELSNHMQFFIQRKMMEDERWRRLQVVFSGVEVPGEGEHKVLDYIRHKVQEPRFNPNTTCCIYGPDADLIMLALTTHLPFVCIIREQLKPRSKNTTACKRVQRKDTFDFIWINVVRQYFEIEFGSLKEKMQERYNVDKIIDDFIFLCFFIGNDFLPRVFCMDIKIGNFDKLIEIFKETLIESDGYINEKGVIVWYRAVKLFKKIAEFELKFIGDKLVEQENQQRFINKFDDMFKEDIEEENKEFLKQVRELKKSFEEYTGGDESEVKVGLEGTELLQELQEEKERERGTPRKLTPRNLQRETEEEEDKNAKFKEDLINAGITNIEEAEKYLIQNVNEEKIARLLSAKVLEKDIKFMSSLVKIYNTNSSDARHYYYEEKYRINIEKNPQELTSILTSYMQGLQFVLSYYYIGCPSWSWYYPHFYSPLVSDLANLMTHLNLPQTTESLISLDKGVAFDPYKQLLLILPIGSIHLLPEPMRGIITNPEAPLHKYYPLEFEVDPFGAVFESEYIAKIPYVDDDLLEEEYQKALKAANLSDEEKRRNRLGENYIYEWDQQSPEVEVKSSLPQYYENFRVRINVTPFQLDKLPFDPKRILEGIPKGSYPYHRSFPSLHYIPEKLTEMRAFQKRDVTFYKCCFKVTEPLPPDGSKDYRKFLEKPYNCLYPFLVRCVVIGIVTPDQLITKIHPQELPFSYSRPDHKNFYEDLILNIHEKYFNDYGIILGSEKPNFAVVSCESELRKDSLGNLYCPDPIIDIIPLDLLVSSQFKGKYQGTAEFTSMNLQTEFPKYSEVVINMGEFIGSTAKVTGYANNNFDFDEVEVRIIKNVPNLATITREIAYKYDSQYNYRSVQGIAKQIGVDMAVVYQILDAVIIKTQANEAEKSVYPDRFDLGLNLIGRKNHTIVPELIICHELESKNRSRSFPVFQLSAEAAQLVIDYHANFKELFLAINEKVKTNDPSMLTAEYIFPNSRDPNLDLLKIYIWLIKQDSANLILANKASKVLTREGIKELEDTLDKQANNAQNSKKIPPKPLLYNPNFLIPKYENTWIPPLYFKKPPWHKIGDRIVNLKINGSNFAPFGACGTVVGILGNKPQNGVLEVKVEVLFDKPFLGGSNLGGRCKWGRGAVIDFDDIFNLSCWDKFVKPRDRRRNLYYEGWDGMITRSYVPTFQVKDDPTEGEESKTGEDQEKKAFTVLTRNLQDLLPQNQQLPQGTEHKQEGVPQHNPPQNIPQNQNLSDLKQFQAFIAENQDQKQNQTQETNDQLRKLYEFTTQISSNESKTQQKANTFIPKTLGLKQPSTTTTTAAVITTTTTATISTKVYEKPSTHHEKQRPQYEQRNQYEQRTQYERQGNQYEKQRQYEPRQQYEKSGNQYQKPQHQQGKEARYEKKYETKTFVQKGQNTQQQNQPQGQSQGSFNFDTFLASNLSNIVQTSNVPQTQKTELNEHSLKEALNIPTSGKDQSKKKLNLGSTTFKVVQRPDQGKTVDVSELEKTEAKPAETQNLLQNLFTNPSALGLDIGLQQKNVNAPETQAALQNFMTNIGQTQSNSTQDQNNFQNLIAGLPNVNVPQVNQTETQSNFQNLIAGLPNINAPQTTQTESQNNFQNLIANLGPNVNIPQGNPVENQSGNVIQDLLANLGPAVNIPQGNIQTQPVANLDDIEKNYQGSPMKEAKDIVHDSSEQGNSNNQ